MGPIIYMTVGISGSGKSKFADYFLKGVQATEINLDNIRKELGDISDQSQNDKVFKMADGLRVVPRGHERVQVALELAQRPDVGDPGDGPAGGVRL